MTRGSALKNWFSITGNLYKDIGRNGMFPGGDFSLEVSSPGLDEPLKLHRQYLKNIGRYVEVTEKEGDKTGRKTAKRNRNGDRRGRRKRAKGRKRKSFTHDTSFDNIKTTKIQIKF